MDKYASHLPILVDVLIGYNKPMHFVELGCGYYSTPIISRFASQHDVYYYDESWAERIKPLCLESTTFHMVENLEEWQYKGEADIIMLDNEELIVNRARRIPNLKSRCSILLVHDADTYTKRGVPLEDAELVYDLLEPHTALIFGEDALPNQCNLTLAR